MTGVFRADLRLFFIIENDQKEYNRIGTPTAKIHRHIQDNEEIIYVDPGKATLYNTGEHI